MNSHRAVPLGRPRGFDVDDALERAMEVFWRQGFEGASLTDLTDAMGITRTSMYAAFGNKEDLFREALRLYGEGPGGYVTRALQAPSAKEVAQAFLRGAVEATTNPDWPAGCLGVQGSLAAGHAGRPARDMLSQWREEAWVRLRDRFATAVAEGDLPRAADPALLARYLLTVGNGIAVQAAGGVGADELRRVADAALLGWPPA